MSQLFIPDKSSKVLVVGDVILDRYIHGNTTRISPEAPVPIVHVQHIEERPGGAANVALNISGLGLGVILVGICGDDTDADTLTRLLTEVGVDCRFIRQKGFSTITKLRVLSQHQQLIRLDYESRPDTDYADGMFKLFKEQIETAEVVVLSDYAKGSLASPGAYIETASSARKLILIDPKGSDFNRYQGASLLTPNLKEFETIVGPCPDLEAIAEKGQQLCKSLSLEALLITRGEHGVTLVQSDHDVVHMKAHAREVFDVTGAGDTVIATMAAALASGYNYHHAMAFSNRAAGLAVAKLGAVSVSVNELNHAINQGNPESNNFLNEEQLLQVIKELRAKGETIVMTNGCFDILHAGHVKYLQQAKQMGDHLVVAVNDDNSVRKLKGDGRPVNPLLHRLVVLNALKHVDYVISFTEDTPERLIKQVAPDILVKGGDYETDQIAGADIVRQYGGDVQIIPLFEDCSTSRILGAREKNNK